MQKSSQTAQTGQVGSALQGRVTQHGLLPRQCCQLAYGETLHHHKAQKLPLKNESPPSASIQLTVCELKPMRDFPVSPANSGDQGEGGGAAPDTEMGASATSNRGCSGGACFRRREGWCSMAHLLGSVKSCARKQGGKLLFLIDSPPPQTTEAV